MKKVLIPTYAFYPLNNGGTFRIAKFAEYLKMFGWSPIVVAPNWTSENTDNYDISMEGKIPCQIERVNYDPHNSFNNNIIYRLSLDPAYMSDKLPLDMFNKCCEVCNRERIDAIFASSLPSFIHWIAAKLSKTYKIPWVADFRDIIDQEEIIEKNKLIRIKEQIRRHQIVHLDSKYVKSASIITTVSDGLADKLRKRNKVPVKVIMNGFDPTDFAHRERNSDKDRFNIVYSGSLFGNSNPQIFMEGMDLFLDNNPECLNLIRVIFYGESSQKIIAYMSDVKHKSVYIQGGFIQHSESINRIMNADVLYLISHPSKGIVTGKIFEYLAAERPILSVPGDGDITDKILREANVGYIASSPEDVFKCLTIMIEQWKKIGKVDIKVNEIEKKKYTRQQQSKQLASLFDRILDEEII